MDKAARAPYEERSKREKALAAGETVEGKSSDKGQTCAGAKYSSQGVPLAEIAKKRNADEQRVIYMRQRIKQVLDDLPYPKGKQISIISQAYYSQNEALETETF